MNQKFELVWNLRQVYYKSIHCGFRMSDAYMGAEAKIQLHFQDHTIRRFKGK
jgi:hypothetical protein